MLKSNPLTRFWCRRGLQVTPLHFSFASVVLVQGSVFAGSAMAYLFAVGQAVPAIVPFATVLKVTLDSTISIEV